ncbi:Uncharacterized protein TCM_014333 [Theobroma cacao]|uniref:Uncharacterized protein n=1 Tax=Theobroma cacao TaxID=3641 RepID=A0A061FXZ0_THECC|nr:Uncharacterized protein TCM_014333 [Theobroma cacao]
MLIAFEMLSRLKINFGKTSLFLVNGTRERWEELARNLNCKAGSLPSNYLEISLGANSGNKPSETFYPRLFTLSRSKEAMVRCIRKVVEKVKFRRLNLEEWVKALERGMTVTETTWWESPRVDMETMQDKRAMMIRKNENGQPSTKDFLKFNTDGSAKEKFEYGKCGKSVER